MMKVGIGVHRFLRHSSFFEFCRSYAVESCFFLNRKERIFNRKVSQSKPQSSAKIYFETLRNFAGTLRNFAVRFYDAEIP
ncbi:MAG: hypothetical protein BWK80_01580 [Desulfobacteraceae bacterium IS3]|nr:MAG: hypothetical protein BWK80_01580 [Desulfobacteraceae bacterium IS3]